MSRPVFIDAALFMGMHGKDESTRWACKAFFAAQPVGEVHMSWEQVGRCDDLVWRYPREVQDAYYPFMDNLHTDLSFTRIGYTKAEIRYALSIPELNGLPDHERLLLAQVIQHEGVLHTASPRLLGATGLPIAPLAVPASEPSFAGRLEALYQDSLVLTVATEEL